MACGPADGGSSSSDIDPEEHPLSQDCSVIGGLAALPAHTRGTLDGIAVHALDGAALKALIIRGEGRRGIGEGAVVARKGGRRYGQLIGRILVQMRELLLRMGMKRLLRLRRRRQLLLVREAVHFLLDLKSRGVSREEMTVRGELLPIQPTSHSLSSSRRPWRAGGADGSTCNPEEPACQGVSLPKASAAKTSAGVGPNRRVDSRIT